MREIKFRALNADGEWCYGLPSYDLNGDLEMSLASGYTDYGDIEKTLGQFTGLRDKNGVEIYEGDIVSLNGSIAMWEVAYCKVTKCPSLKMIVRYGMEINTFCELYDDDLLDKIEVLGSIHQNPELLK